MISSQMFRRRGNTGQRSVLSKLLDDFKNVIVGLIISVFISKLYYSDRYNNECKSLLLDKFLGSRL